MKKNFFVTKIFFLVLMTVFVFTTLYCDEALVSQIKGKVEISKDGNKWMVISVGTILNSKDKIRVVGKKSRCVLMLENGSVVNLIGDTEAVLENLFPNDVKIKLETGRVRAKVNKLQQGQYFNVATPVAIASIRGTDLGVEHKNGVTDVEVYEGIVEVKEELTGKSVYVKEGQQTSVLSNEPPSQPTIIPKEILDKKQEEDLQTQSEEKRQEIISDAQREMFYQISQEEVLSQASDELKKAEYQLGKTIIDVYGKRVRMEEYIIRPQPNQFKYVVLNTRENRFDFGKMLFTFNDTLPPDLTQVTPNMFYYKGSTKPRWYLTGVDTVMSNTIDQVNEIASGGDMLPDNVSSPTSWNVFFNKYEFYVNQQKRWSFEDANNDKKLSLSEISYFDDNGNKLSQPPISKFEMPSGPNSFHFKQTDTYADGFTISVQDYIINDNGQILTLGEAQQWSKDKLKTNLEKLNFERVYTSSVFEGRKIDLVYSAKLLSDAGILTLPNPAEKQ
jgi:hypothetical protein